MRRIAATLAVVGALLFCAQAAWAEGSNVISVWLESIGLEKYEEEFLNNDITLDILPDLTNVDLKEMGVNSLGARKRILKAIKERPVTFRDCPECPEMVVIPSGSFMMGSPESDKLRYGDGGEHPVHQVSVRQPFAIGKYEVTFAEWDACVADGGCNGYRPDDEGWGLGRGKRPVIYVNWDDAQAYVKWLSKKTGHTYRLPSEAEWEYAARAGTGTRNHFGDSISSSQANYYGALADDRGWMVAVGSYPANAFGLHDVHGNVWEWVEDCWHESYAGAPSDANTWKAGDCSLGVLRGGSWGSPPRFVRSAIRARTNIENRILDNGFRIARTLP